MKENLWRDEESDAAPLRIDRYFHKAQPMATPCIVLINPKYAHNVGQAFRVAACYGATQVWVERIRNAVISLERLPREERNRGDRDVTLIWDADPLAHPPPDAVPVAVEMREQAETLPDFGHPQNAVYIFGPEDGGLDRAVLTRCHRFVRIPTRHCLNLACAVSTVLYDRTAKSKTDS